TISGIFAENELLICNRADSSGGGSPVRWRHPVTTPRAPMPTLFDPVTVGDVHLTNRVVMAPLTRLRAASPPSVPNRLMAEYYVQRATAGLIITEGVPVAPQGVGYPNVPGLWSEEHVAGWRQITDAVHEAGGRMFAQLWHVGRISDPHHLGGETPVAPSAIA